MHYTTELFESIFDALPANAALLDQDGSIVAVNEPWKIFSKQNGGGSDAYIGTNYLEICKRAASAGDVRVSGFVEKLECLLKGDVNLIEFEYPCHSPQTQRWFRLMAQTLEQDGKRFAILLHYDITDKKIAEFSLRRQAEILNSVNDAVIVVDMNDKITYANKAALDLYGWPKSEFVGKLAREILYDQLPSDFEKKRAAVQTSGHWSGEAIQVNRSGKKLTVGARWSAIRNEDGFEAILKVHTDLSLVGQFLRAQRMQTIGNIVGGVAHDLNNILTPIMLLCESIQGGRDRNNAMAAARISDLTDRASALLRQLLGFARGFEGERLRQNAQSLVEEAVSILKLSLPKEIRLNLEMSREPLEIQCNQIQIHQVLMNLCLNSRDAISDEGAISISVHREEMVYGAKAFVGEARPGSYACISVADSGSGISAQDLERIFEPFYSTKPISQGTGLGLSTCLGIVKSHDGFINVRSELGRGSIFSVYLPLTGGVDLTADRKISNLKKLEYVRILIVDDETEIRTFLTNLLMTQGFDVVSASTGEEAIAALVNAEKPINLVITDMNMPGLSGSDLIRHLTQFQPGLRVIGMSGYEIQPAEFEKADDVVVGFLRKPFRSKEILGEIEKALSINS